MRVTDETVDEAARLLAIRLMRLNESMDRKDAEHYSSAPTANGITRREHRIHLINKHYRDWYRSRAL